jgi:hypothetical protein
MGQYGGKYAKRTHPSFVNAMYRDCAYLLEGHIAPVWIGEVDANQPGQGDINYWQNLLRHLKAINAEFGY